MYQASKRHETHVAPRSASSGKAFRDSVIFINGVIFNFTLEVKESGSDVERKGRDILIFATESPLNLYSPVLLDSRFKALKAANFIVLVQSCKSWRAFCLERFDKLAFYNFNHAEKSRDSGRGL